MFPELNSTDLPTLFAFIREHDLADPADCGHDHPGEITDFGIDVLAALTAAFIWNGPDRSLAAMVERGMAHVEMVRDYLQAAIDNVLSQIAENK